MCNTFRSVTGLSTWVIKGLQISDGVPGLLSTHGPFECKEEMLLGMLVSSASILNHKIEFGTCIPSLRYNSIDIFPNSMAVPIHMRICHEPQQAGN